MYNGFSISTTISYKVPLFPKRKYGKFVRYYTNSSGMHREKSSGRMWSTHVLRVVLAFTITVAFNLLQQWIGQDNYGTTMVYGEGRPKNDMLNKNA